MFKVRSTVFAFIFIFVAAPLAFAEDSVPNLVGNWSGKVEAGVRSGSPGGEPDVGEPAFGNYELTFSLAIEKQEGRGLIGTWSTIHLSEKILGVIRQDNQTILLVDEDSYFNARLLSPTAMELCLAETKKESMGVWCLLMNRE